jgi:hypothetical protein
MGDRGGERVIHLGQLQLDLAGMVSKVRTGNLHFPHQIFFWQGKDSVYGLYQIHPPVEQNEPTTHEMPYQTRTSMALGCSFLDLAREISKRQPIQFALEERYYSSGLSFLPPL